jgi:hypothetical protein
MRASAVEVVLEHGHWGLQMDSTHGTNYYTFPLFTILVVDAHGNEIPVAWFFCTTENADCIAQFLDAFKKRVS